MKKILCFLLGHNYKIEIFFSKESQKLKCLRCNKSFGINHKVKTILDWDYELQEFYELFYPEKFKNN